MNAPTGTPYPWNTRRWDTRARNNAAVAHRPIVLCDIAAAVTSGGVANLAGWGAHRAWFTRNDGWAWRGITLAVVGCIGVLAVGTPTDLWGAADHALRAAATQTGGTVGAVAGLWARLVWWGCLFAGAGALLRGYRDNIMYSKHTVASQPGVREHARARRSTRTLVSGATRAGRITHGVHVDSVVPWHTPRYGALIEQPANRAYVTLVTGQQGTGKTVYLLCLADQHLANGSGVVFVDLKAAAETVAVVRSITRHHQAPTVEILFGDDRHNTRTWVDPIVFTNDNDTDLAELIAGALGLDDPGTGGDAYYIAAARTWLPLQLEILRHIPPPAGKSTLAMLRDTCNPDVLQAWARDGAARTPHIGDTTLNGWLARMEGRKASDLNRLRSDLDILTQTGGAAFTPQRDPGTGDWIAPLDIDHHLNAGGMLYFAASAGANPAAVRILGALLLRMMSMHMARRSTRKTPGTRPAAYIIDEASTLEGSADVIVPILRQIRSSGDSLCLGGQTWFGFTPTVRSEIVNAATCMTTLRTEDEDTIAMVAPKYTRGPIMQSNTYTDQHASYSNDDTYTTPGTGGRDNIIQGVLYVTPSVVASLPNHHALITFGHTPLHKAGHKPPTNPKERAALFSTRRVKNPDIVSDTATIRIVPPHYITNPDPGTTIPGTSEVDEWDSPGVWDDTDVPAPVNPFHGLPQRTPTTFRVPLHPDDHTPTAAAVSKATTGTGEPLTHPAPTASPAPPAVTRVKATRPSPRVKPTQPGTTAPVAPPAAAARVTPTTSRDTNTQPTAAVTRPAPVVRPATPGTPPAPAPAPAVPEPPATTPPPAPASAEGGGGLGDALRRRAERRNNPT